MASKAELESLVIEQNKTIDALRAEVESLRGGVLSDPEDQKKIQSLEQRMVFCLDELGDARTMLDQSRDACEKLLAEADLLRVKIIQLESEKQEAPTEVPVVTGTYISAKEITERYRMRYIDDACIFVQVGGDTITL